MTILKKVKCIDNTRAETRLTLDKIYNVYEISNEPAFRSQQTNMLYFITPDAGDVNWFLAKRFKDI